MPQKQSIFVMRGVVKQLNEKEKKGGVGELGSNCGAFDMLL